jgi:glycosyltransferase involved in cell wall biosynthesis
LSAGAVRLTVVIPALNEEDAIGGTLECCLAARAEIVEGTGVTEVCLVVVSDGSTDRTAEIARRHEGVTVVEFPENRGYGAAIKAGWEQAPADLLGFLDADGTCDPRFFVPMCRKVLEEGYDLVLGGRMGPGSRMPLVRRAGNLAFAILLGHLSRKQVRDTASGQRVVRRQALPRLLPLPDGLHFTPAMSARALMDDDIRIAEIEMPYRERVGRSKLRVVRDGLRFLGVILDTAAYVRVSRLTVPLVLALSALAAMVMVAPTVFYLRHARLEEWMFYRFAFAGTIGTMAVVVLCATVVVEHVSALTFLRYSEFGPRTRGLWRYENLRALLLVAAMLGAGGLWLNWEGGVQLLTTGHVTLHWSRVVVGGFFGVNLMLLLSAFGTIRIVRALHQRQPYLRRRDDADGPDAPRGPARTP